MNTNLKQMRRRGAPPKQNPAKERFEVRCTPDQKAQWASAASRNGLAVGTWLKQLADKASGEAV